MKVLLHDDTPAYLCHGGKQVLAEKLYGSLRDLGVDVEQARWWDPDQQGDLLHSFGCSPSLVAMAHQAGVRVVLTHIVDEMANSTRARRRWQRARNGAIRRLAPAPIRRLFPWHVLPSIDQLVYINQADADTAISTYGIPRHRTEVIPHGCSAADIERLGLGPRAAASYLVSVGSIVPRKNTVVLARAARRARLPIVFLGKAFRDDDPYFEEFAALVDDKNVIYPGHVSEEEKTAWLVGASGFVLPSRAESGCIAVYEAAAAGLPLLLSDRPWARAYGDRPSLHFVEPTEDELAERLEPFFRSSQRLDEPTFPVATWEDIARRYLAVYERAL